MSNQIERDAFVKRDVLKNPIPYTRGTDLLPIVIHFRDFQIPSGATARVFVAKADGNAVYTTATIDGNDVTVDVADQMFIELGMALMQISIMDGEEELVSFVQPVDVKQNLKAGDLPASTTDVKFLDEAIEQANEAVNTATTAAKQAATAVQNANQAIEDANDAISDLNAQIASLNTNFASLANNVSISQLDTTAKTLVGAIDELNSKTQNNPIEYFQATEANFPKYCYEHIEQNSTKAFYVPTATENKLDKYIPGNDGGTATCIRGVSIMTIVYITVKRDLYIGVVSTDSVDTGGIWKSYDGAVYNFD